MTTQETIKPLVDRILSNPLHFKQASGKTEERNSSVIDTQKSSYIVIGNSNSISDKAKTSAGAGEGAGTNISGKAVNVQKGRQMLKVIPKSMAEAINMYTTSIPEKPFANDNSDESLSDVDVNDVKNSAEEDEEEDDEEEFHEAKEYLERDEQQDGLDLPLVFDEDMGMPVEFDKDSTGSSTSTDKDFDIGDSDSDSVNSDDISNVSQNEKVQLQEEAQEAMANANDDALVRDDEGDELKHKIPLSQRSMTPPTTTSDISNFYEFNENINDTGSNAPSRIVKNWGPHLSVLKPRGLLNHGVTCYTNAAVQAMVHIPAIQHYLFDVLRGKYDETIAKDSVTYVLAETSKKMWMPQDKSKKKKKAPYHINPKKLISRLDDINCMMSEWQQEDSHEYFMSLMSRLQEDSVPKGHKLTESIIYDIFGGLLKQEVTCKSCDSISKTEQPFYDLSLHLKGKKKLSPQQDSEDSQNKANKNSGSNLVDVNALTKSGSADAFSAEGLQNEGQDQKSPLRRFSIEKSIKDFFNPELIKVDKEQKGYVCEKCHKTTNAMKHNSILRAPETLLIHLKKFRFNGTSSSKMKQAVSYPMFLDLTEYCEPDEQNHILPVKYQLTTVVVHEGRSLSSGHYIVHCKQPDGSWATYDDEYINKITERDVLKEPNAYYLLYTRLTPKEISFQDSSPLNIDDLNIPFQKASSSSSTTLTPTSSPLLNGNGSNRNKKWKKNKKRRFDN